MTGCSRCAPHQDYSVMTVRNLEYLFKPRSIALCGSGACRLTGTDNDCYPPRRCWTATAGHVRFKACWRSAWNCMNIGFVTVSIGISLFPRRGSDSAEDCQYSLLTRILHKHAQHLAMILIFKKFFTIPIGNLCAPLKSRICLQNQHVIKTSW